MVFLFFEGERTDIVVNSIYRYFVRAGIYFIHNDKAHKIYLFLRAD